MPNVDLPVAGVLPGDPAALRETAARFRTLADTRGQEAVRQTEASRNAAASGWSGAAADAFGSAATNARSRVDEIVRIVPDIAAPLLTYADELERLQREYVEVQAQARQMAGQVRATPAGTPEADTAGRAFLGAQDRLEQILQEARNADQQAAAAVRGLAGRFTDPQIDAGLVALKVGSYPVGQYVAAQGQRIEQVLGPGSAATAAKVGGRLLGPIGAGFSQAIRDSANPNYSTAERFGRATGNAIVVGVPSAIGAAAGGTIAAAGGAFLGPVGAFVAGAAGAYGGATAVGGIVDALGYGDDAVDATGEVFDWFGEQMRPPVRRHEDG